jgi:hypothetical protein
MAYNIYKRIFGIMGASALLLFSFFAHPAQAQTPEISSALTQTKEAVNKLFEIKDNSNIPEEEKKSLELSLKKDITKGVIEIAQKQLASAKETIRDITFPDSEDWKNLRDAFGSKIAEYETYYEELLSKSSAATTTDDIKTLAQNLEARKTSEIDVLIQQISNIQTTLSLSDIITLARERLGKVETDVTKIYDQNLAKDETLRAQLGIASRLIGESKEIVDRAASIMLATYPAPEQTTSTPSDFIKTLASDVNKMRRDAAARENLLGVPLPSPIPVKDLKAKDIQPYVTSLNHAAIEKIKSAYDTFLSMTKSVATYLR